MSPVRPRPDRASLGTLFLLPEEKSRGFRPGFLLWKAGKAGDRRRRYGPLISTTLRPENKIYNKSENLKIVECSGGR